MIDFADNEVADMANPSSERPRIVRFGTFEADLGTRELRKGGVRIKVHGQPFEVLAMLLARPGEVVPREELRQRLWSTDTFVDFDAGLNTAINRLREALGDSADNPRFIETVPRRGYRLVAPVEAEISKPRAADERPSEAFSDFTQTAAPTSRRIKAQRVMALTLGLGLIVVVLAALSLTGMRERLFGRQNAAHIESLAVLPLANLSGDPKQDFFADGMTEDLITDLGKIGALRVISRTSVVQYKVTKQSLPEIARELNVDALVEGTVTRSGNHLKITASLLQAAPERHLWAESYESEAGDVLTLQGQVAQAIAQQIQVKLTPDEQKLLGRSRSVDPQAHDDYLRGRYLCGKDTRETLEKGSKYFELAIQEAPSDPLGYAGLANCYVLLAWGGDIFVEDPSAAQILPKVRDAATQALRLDGNLAEAHTSLACVEMVLNWNSSGAEREFKRAIELNPNYSPAHVYYAHYLAAMGRSDESVAEAKRSIQLDPFSTFTMDFSDWVFYLDRHYELAEEQARRTLELTGSEMQWSHYDFGQLFYVTGRRQKAIEEFIEAQEVFGLRTDRLVELQTAYQQYGEKGYWRKALEFCEEASKERRKFATASGYGFCDYVKNLYLALFHFRLGELDAGFQALESAYTKHETELIYLNVDPQWDDVRSDPRFQSLVRRIGLKN